MDVYDTKLQTLIGLTGAAGSGKDSVAGIMVLEHGFQQIAFADALYEEVSTAFNVSVEFLKNRNTKERQAFRLSMRNCTDAEFVRTIMRMHGISLLMRRFWRWQPRSPRQILQWWGTDYRRARCEAYWIDKVCDRLMLTPNTHWVITDVRFPNEADLVREFGGQLGLVLRPGVEPVANHVSEAFWQTCNPDIVIRNDGTLEGLQNTVNEVFSQ